MCYLCYFSDTEAFGACFRFLHYDIMTIPYMTMTIPYITNLTWHFYSDNKYDTGA